MQKSSDGKHVRGMMSQVNFLPMPVRVFSGTSTFQDHDCCRILRKVRKMLANNPSYRLKEDMGTGPRVYYLPAARGTEAN